MDSDELLEHGVFCTVNDALGKGKITLDQAERYCETCQFKCLEN